jgi:hypothetical protein
MVTRLFKQLYMYKWPRRIIHILYGWSINGSTLTKEVEDRGWCKDDIEVHHKLSVRMSRINREVMVWIH